MLDQDRMRLTRLMWTSMMLLKEYFHLPNETGLKPSDVPTQSQLKRPVLSVEGIHLVPNFHKNSILFKNKLAWF